ncbi:hypothetical protein LDENG_00283090 [Lucifuga dentata]|nr:hypothetical protein LDENG_00283090 [Lucifuga dentata]
MLHVLRTSEKLQTTRQSASAADRHHVCLLCMSDLDTTTVENTASAFQAMLISEQLSQRKAPGVVTAGTQGSRPAPGSAVPTGRCCSSGGAEDCGKTGSGQGCYSSAKDDTSELRSVLCYSCQLTIKDMTSAEFLPPYILSEAQRRQRRSQMREEISEFLLDEADEDDEETK